MIPATEALTRLIDGNRRFVSDLRSINAMPSQSRRNELVGGQEPFAIILGCSDSRAPAELVFDQGLGDLFVVRVAGNIATPSQVGSVEFSATAHGARLVVVMGHSQCGAIEATLSEIQQPGDHSPNLKSIVDNIRPHIEGVVKAHDDTTDDRATLSQRAVRANVRACADHLRHGSAVLKDLIDTENLLVVGAEYSLETGVVDFFDTPGISLDEQQA